jgi:hypothetical protein
MQQLQQLAVPRCLSMSAAISRIYIAWLKGSEIRRCCLPDASCAAVMCSALTRTCTEAEELVLKWGRNELEVRATHLH